MSATARRASPRKGSSSSSKGQAVSDAIVIDSSPAVLEPEVPTINGNGASSSAMATTIKKPVNGIDSRSNVADMHGIEIEWESLRPQAGPSRISATHPTAGPSVPTLPSTSIKRAASNSPPAPTTSSEDLTDIEVLAKALTPKKKRKPAVKKEKKDKVDGAEDQTKKKGKGKAIENGDNAAVNGVDKMKKARVKSEENGENGTGDEENRPKKKAKRAPRTKKTPPPFLPVVDYPTRFLESKKFVGAHVSISDGAHYAPHRALRIGAKAFGLFTKSQRQWVGKPLSDDSIRLFPLRCNGKTELLPSEDGTSGIVTLGDGIGFNPLKHIVPHGSYLTNLCNPDADKRKKSYENFLDELKRAEALGIGLFNIHPGSTVGECTREQAYATLAQCINDAHRETEFVVVLLENMAAGNNIIGGTFEDLAAVIALVDNKSRVGICFDTCHAFAAGYDMRTPETFEATFKQLDEIVGLKYLKAFHMNDSEKGLGSRRDLHANIGAGELGLSAFHLLMRDPRFDDLPFILETPMIDGTLNVDAKPGKGANGAAKSETKEDGDDVDDGEHDHAHDADVEDNEDGGSGLSVGASTWMTEIQLLHELEKVPFGQSNATINRLSADIMSIVEGMRKRDEERKQAVKDKKQAAKDAKTAEKIANGEIVPKKKVKEEKAKDKEVKPRKPRAKKVKIEHEEVKLEAEAEPEIEMEVDSSEIDQLASDYEDPEDK